MCVCVCVCVCSRAHARARAGELFTLRTIRPFCIFASLINSAMLPVHRVQGGRARNTNTRPRKQQQRPPTDGPSQPQLHVQLGIERSLPVPTGQPHDDIVFTASHQGIKRLGRWRSRQHRKPLTTKSNFPSRLSPPRNEAVAPPRDQSGGGSQDQLITPLSSN